MDYGWLLDKEGNPTVDPNAANQGGVILPLGGAEGHKGYGLSVMIEILSGILTGLGQCIAYLNKAHASILVCPSKVMDGLGKYFDYGSYLQETFEKFIYGK